MRRKQRKEAETSPHLQSKITEHRVDRESGGAFPVQAQRPSGGLSCRPCRPAGGEQCRHADDAVGTRTHVLDVCQQLSTCHRRSPRCGKFFAGLKSPSHFSSFSCPSSSSSAPSLRSNYTKLQQHPHLGVTPCRHGVVITAHTYREGAREPTGVSNLRPNLKS